jgi:hypothetical protein
MALLFGGTGDKAGAVSFTAAFPLHNSLHGENQESKILSRCGMSDPHLQTDAQL